MLKMRLITPIALAVLAACSQSPNANEPHVGDATEQSNGRRPEIGLAPPSGAPLLIVPIDCKLGETCVIQNYVDRDPGPDARDYRCGQETYQDHAGVDFRIPDMAAQRAGVAVIAAAPGRVMRVRDGVSDVSVKAAGAAAVAGQECGNGVVVDHGQGWETQYCHLARGSVRVQAGDRVSAGDPIGLVGLSGNTEYAHVHFTVRRNGVAVDPFMPSTDAATCSPDVSVGGLWRRDTSEALAYRRGAVLNFGFSGAAVDGGMIEAGTTPSASRRAPALVTYVRAINLQEGDVQVLQLVGPRGQVLAEQRLSPLDRAKAQYFIFIGARTPVGGWPAGKYSATFNIVRDGAPDLSKTIDVMLPEQ